MAWAGWLENRKSIKTLTFYLSVVQNMACYAGTITYKIWCQEQAVVQIIRSWTNQAQEPCIDWGGHNIRLVKRCIQFQCLDVVSEDVIKTMLNVCHCLVHKSNPYTLDQVETGLGLTPRPWNLGKCEIKQQNFPTIWAVLALDTWYYCSEEPKSPTYPQDCRIFFIYLNNVNKAKKVLLPFNNPYCHKVAHFLLFNETNEGKHWEESVGLLGLNLQRNSSNCPVLILHIQLGNYLLHTGESYCLTAQQIHKTLGSMFDIYPHAEYSQRSSTGHCVESWCWSIVMMYMEKQ